MVKPREVVTRPTFEAGELTCSDAAVMVGVTRRTVLRWICDGKDGTKLRARLTVGGHARIALRDWEAFCCTTGVRGG